MDIAQVIWNILRGYYNAADMHLENIQAGFISIILGMAGLVLVMFGFNAGGLKMVNIFFFFAGGFFIVLHATRPAALGVSALVGLPFGGPTEGIRMLYRATLGLLIGFFGIALILSIVSFEDAKTAFFTMLMGMMLMGVTSAFYDVKTDTLKTVLMWGSGLLIALSLLGVLFSGCTKKDNDEVQPSQQQAQPATFKSMTGVPEQLFNTAAQTAGATPTTGELYVRNGECSTMNIPEGKWLDYTFPTGYVRAEIQTTYGGPWLPQQNNGNTVAVRWCGEGKVTWTIRS